MIPRTNPPPLRQEPPNYAILDLNGDYSDIHASWRKCMIDFRHWCYNNSEKRYDYGGTDKRSCEAPGSGHFCIFTTYQDKWMCSIVDGATLYMHGHITRSVGPSEERRICENKQADGKAHLIEDSEFMEWNGSYVKEPLPVGAGALISSFTPLYKRAEGEKIPMKVLRRAGQVYFLHFPEAGRFDSLCLDKIDKHFIAGGIVQVTDIERHQNWSADCKEIRAEIGRPAPRTDKEIENRGKVQLMIKDIRVMHKPGVRDCVFKLQNMPFQLDKNGRVQDPLEVGEGGGGGGDGGRGAGRGGRERGDRGGGRARGRGPPGQNAEQQNTDDTNPDFLIGKFGNFAKISKFHLEVSADSNQLYDLALTSDPVRVFRRLLLQKSCRLVLNLAPYGDSKIRAAFRTEEIPRVPLTPHDEMHARMSHFHSIMGKGVPKFLNRVDTAPKKRVPYVQLPYLMIRDHNGNHRVTPTRGICLLAGMLDVNLCSTQIENLMFELFMWRCVDELSAKADQHQSTRKAPAKHFTELWTPLPQSEPAEEFSEKMACQGPYLSTNLTAGLLAH